jgi:hypothetical protein
MLNAEKPDGIGAFVRSGVAVEEVSNCFVKMTFPVLGSRQERRGGGLSLW